MRWLLLFVAVSASADCTSHLLYTTPDYITRAVVDDGALYVSLLLSGEVDRIDLATGERSVAYLGPPVRWDVQHGLLVTPATVGRPAEDVLGITIRDGSVYWLETDNVLRRMILGGGTAMTLAEEAAQWEVFGDRIVYGTPEGKLLWKRLTDSQPTLISDRFLTYKVFADRIVYVTDHGKLFWRRFSDTEPTFVMSNVISIGTITPEALLITTVTPTADFYTHRFQVLRISWSGEVETLYQMEFFNYHNAVSLGAFDLDGVVYINQMQQGTAVYKSTLLAVRESFVHEIYSRIGPIWILDTSGHGITFANWGSSTGFHDVVQLQCPPAPKRTRTVR